MGEERKQANGNLFSHSSLAQAKNGGERVALMPATEKAVKLMEDDIKKLCTEQTGWKMWKEFSEKCLERAKQKC